MATDQRRLPPITARPGAGPVLVATSQHTSTRSASVDSTPGRALPRVGVHVPTQRRVNRLSSVADDKQAAIVKQLATHHDYLFDRQHPVRLVAKRITRHRWFEPFVMVLIMVNVAAMAVEDVSARMADLESSTNNVVHIVDVVTLALFTVELCLRVLSTGLCPLPTWAPACLRPDNRLFANYATGGNALAGAQAAASAGAAAAQAAAKDAMERKASMHKVSMRKDRKSSKVVPSAPPPSSPSSSDSDAYDAVAVDSGDDALETDPMRAAQKAYDDAVTAELEFQRTLAESTSNGYYLASGWNRLDAFVVLVGFASLALPSAGIGLSGLRALRALRPLRAFHFFAPLRVLLKSLWKASWFLVNVLVCLGFFFAFFALVGLSTYMGSLRRRCVIPQGDDALRFDMGSSGFAAAMAAVSDDVAAAPTNYTVFSPTTWCSFESNPKSFQCGDLGVLSAVAVGNLTATVPLLCADIASNPATNFDNTASALYSVFVVTSLEGWTDLQYILMDAEYGLLTVLFMVLLVVLVNFVGVQLFTTVLCATSLEVRAEEEVKRLEQATILRRQRELFEERSRVIALVKRQAENWKEGTAKRRASQARRGSKGPRRDSAILGVVEAALVRERVNRAKEKEEQRLQARQKCCLTRLCCQFGAAAGKGAHRVVSNPVFERFIIACILINAISIGTEHYDMSKLHTDVLGVAEFGFAVVFASEMILKMFALGGIRAYLKDSMNVFDGIVVVTSAPSLVTPFITGSFGESASSELAAISALRVFRLFRVFRLARLLHKLQSMRELLVHVFFSFSPVINLTSFILFTLISGSILAMNLFARPTAPTEDVQDLLNAEGFNVYAGGPSPRYHFDTFSSCMLSLFIIMTGENWTDFLDYLKSLDYDFSGTIFVIGFLVLGNYALVSLFVAVILENFELEEATRLEQQHEAYQKLRKWLHVKVKGQLKAEAKQQKLASAASMGSGSSVGSEVLGSPSGTGSTPLTPESDTVSAFRHTSHSREAPEATATLGIVSLSPARVPPPLRDTVSSSSSAPSPVARPPMRSMSSDAIQPDFAKKAIGVRRKSLGWWHLRKMQSEVRKLNNSALDMTAMSPPKPKVEVVTLGGKALCCLGQHNCLRRACHAVATSRWFDMVILVFIVASSVSLAFDAPTVTDRTPFFIADLVFLSAFGLEFIIKLIAFGGWGTGEGAYFRSSWNVADFVLLVGSGIATLFDQLLTSQGGLGVLRVFRLGRTLRPLRVIRSNASMRIVVTSLMTSFTKVLNVYFLAQFVAIIFAIVGVSLFSGAFFFCTNPAAVDRDSCVGQFVDADGVNATAAWVNPSYAGITDNPTFNFDDLGNAYLTVTEVIGLEGFVEVMGAAMDVTAVGEQPRFGTSPLHSLYFVVVIVVSTFFITELYAGVIIQSYTKADGTAFLTDDQRAWADEKSRLRSMKLRKQLNQTNVSPFRRFVQDLVVPCRETCETCSRGHHAFHSRMDSAVAGLVLINVAVLAARHYGMSDTTEAALDTLDATLLALFTVEMALKHVALGVKTYWHDFADAFDGSIVIGSLLVVILSVFSIDFLGVAQLARLFRIGRLLRLVKRFPQLSTLMETLFRALPSMGNITALLILVLFIGSIVGMELFGDVPYRLDGPGLTRHANFQSFPSALMLMFRALTGENIQVVMRDCQRVHAYAPVFFILFNDLGKYVFLSLYLATIMDKLASAARKTPKLHEAHYERFEKVWRTVDPNVTGFIPIALLRPFLKRLGPPLGGPMRVTEFAAWYGSMFSMVQPLTTKDGKVSFKDLLTLLPTVSANPKRLLVTERLQRDVLQATAAHTLAALRIQGLFRGVRARRTVSKLRAAARRCQAARVFGAALSVSGSAASRTEVLPVTPQLPHSASGSSRVAPAPSTP